MTMSQQVAWIGLGNMGRGMVKNIVEKANLDKPILIFNRTTLKAEQLSSSLPAGKSKVSTDLTQVVQESDIIFICLADDKAVTDSFNVMLKGDAKDKLFVDCSTIHPDTTDELAAKVTEAGAKFVACPVFGLRAQADSGQLVCVLAGPTADVERVKPFCKGVMGRANLDLANEPPSSATCLKVIGNTLILNMVETLSEGHVLAEKSGLGSDRFHEFISTLFPGPYTAYSQRMISGDYHKRESPLVAVDLARKDASHAMDLAKRSGCRMKAIEIADQHLQQVKEHAGSNGDIAGIYGAVRKESGLDFEN